MDVLDACPSVGWKVVVGLCRFAGLRCPSEVGSVTWADVNWEKGRLTVRSQKTEHHGADHAVRVVPISADLRLILDDAWSVAGEGATLVAPQAANPTSNLRTTMEKVIVRAGHQPWARLFQNLRASCETDWVEQYPAHVVAKWLGHSPKVAAQHYLMSRDHHFEDVVGGAGGPVRPESKRERTNVKSNAVPTRNPTPQVSAGVCGVSHQTTEPAVATRVTAGSSGIEPVVKTGKWRGQEANKRGFVRESRGASPSATRNATRFPKVAWNCSPGPSSWWPAWRSRSRTALPSLPGWWLMRGATSDLERRRPYSASRKASRWALQTRA